MINWWKQLINSGILIGAVCFVLFFSSAFAQFETIDCVETAQTAPDAFVQKILQNVANLNPAYTLTIFTDKDLKTVLWHTQQFCCQKNINDATCDGKLDGKLYFPESPYLIDHLINIGMRKFNGIQEHCDTLWIDCTTRDNKVLLKEWREESEKLADDTDGVPPSELYELFKKYWWDVTTFGKTENNTQIANAYYTMCYEAARIRLALLANQASAVNTESTRLKWCQNLVQQRYLEESAYVQSLMVDKGVQYMYDNMRAYLKTHFVDNRMNGFVDKFGKLDACLNMVLKYVTRTSCCVD
jgi:hypothetical protein